MKYQLLFVFCIIFFATTTVNTVEANPLIEAPQMVKSTLDDLIWLAQNPTLQNALYVLKKNGWGSVAPYVAGVVRMQAHDDYATGKVSSGTEEAHYEDLMDQLTTMINALGNTTSVAY